MDRRRRLLSEDEIKLWRRVMQDSGTQPLHPSEALPPEPSPEPAPADEPVATGVSRALMAPPPPDVRAKTSLPFLDHGHAPGLDRANADRLRQGEKPIEARLDLHGLTQDAAHAALARFIGSCWERGLRCVLVITGKGNRDGSGVLRAQVPRWLNEAAFRPRILAFTHAKPKDGGEGALYVLLKRRR